MTKNQNTIELNACLLFELWQVSPVIPDGTRYLTNAQEIENATNALQDSLLFEFRNEPNASEIVQAHVENLKREFDKSTSETFAAFNDVPKKKRTPATFARIRKQELQRAFCFWELNLTSALRLTSKNA